MNSAEAMLENVKRSVSSRNAEQPADGEHECLAVCPCPDGIHVDFWGEALGDSCGELMAVLGSSEVAPWLRSISLRGPDEGANGTRNWDLTPLVETGAEFTRLLALTIQQTAPWDHNRTIVASSFDEEGVLGRLLALAPSLRLLVSPSAPDASFFRAGQRPLRYLSVDAGYAHQDFILNLSRSSSFPQLRAVAWGEYNETYLENFADHVTPLGHYRELFSSPAFSSVGWFELRNPALDPAELHSLRRLRDRRFQFKVVRCSSEYIRLATVHGSKDA